MGFLGGDNDKDTAPGDTEGEQLADQQLRQNQVELEAKKQSLYQTRLDIIKGQGAEQWSPNKGPGVQQRSPMKASSFKPFKPF